MGLDKLLLINKPADITSFGVVARVRRIVTERARANGWTGKRVKVGHTGTLDPFATGLMIILTGKRTKEARKYSHLDKIYEATIILGATSTTGDPEGEINISSTRSIPSKLRVEQVLKSFVGEIKQVPPIYSAIKIGGQRAYKLARSGRIPKIPDRKVTIFNIELLSYSYPELKIRTHVSSGTYIRTLAEDIGKKLEVGAYTSQLHRTKIGGYNIKDASPLAEFMNI